ncbi:hypothetical protein MRB53_022106 [Persea americana]|uniref:Uncharacterized protein n=1 Tax=Persea americana TaxID=3435 RepID=A0ACC2L6W1_PERAE|nr:hypothetical protein MRB53_022106 [Persea americana]
MEGGRALAMATAMEWGADGGTDSGAKRSRKQSNKENGHCLCLLMAVEQNPYGHKGIFIALYQELNGERYQLDDDLGCNWSKLLKRSRVYER